MNLIPRNSYSHMPKRSLERKSDIRGKDNYMTLWSQNKKDDMCQKQFPNFNLLLTSKIALEKKFLTFRKQGL